MRVIRPVPPDEVLTTFRRDHPPRRRHTANSNQSAVEALELAGRAFGGWTEVRISRAEVLGVMLPWHTSEGGGFEVVPRTGRTVAEAVGFLRGRAGEMTRANPVCAAKLDLFRDAPIGPVYLSTRPLPHSDYAGLPEGEGLVHLDGLHRMLAWELAARLPKDTGVTAFVCGALGTGSPAEGRGA
ncbi:DUF6309 family protein [Streptomyces sp. NPDC050560]|uniref:DUF6309 family protein n=1 Tax=Streptomyces sp. NPDC050560 TaxID=3365630 RepID=UPI0037AA2CA5